MTKQRIIRISLTSIIIFALLLGGQLLYKNQWLNQSVSSDTQGIAGIGAVRIVNAAGKSELQVETEHVQNLQSICGQLQNVAGQYPIRLMDRRTEELEKVFQSMQFSLYESISRGNFTEMEKTLKGLAEQSGMELELSMDADAIYLTLSKAGNQLVDVLERHDQGKYLTSRKI